MAGFRGAASLDELVREDPGRLLEISREALGAAQRGPDPVDAFLSISLEPREAEPGAGSVGSGPLAGIPVALKDNLVTSDFPTTCGSRLLEGYRSPFDATVVRSLREAGAVVVGKTNMDEFAMGSSTELSAFGPTRNPIDRGRVPGGSSGGSAAAVAAGIVPVALGTDTGGSVRQPAALCGVVGLKPTYGRISRYGTVAFASSLDHVGVIGRTVADVARVLSVVAGPDPRDATSGAGPPGVGEPTVSVSAAGAVVGVPDEYFPDWLDPGVRSACEAALRRLEALGATVRRVSLPGTHFVVPTYQAIASAEASSNLARFDGARFGVRGADDRLDRMYGRTRAALGPEVKRRILLGTAIRSRGDRLFHQASRSRAVITGELQGVLSAGVDVVFTPTTATPAFELGSRLADPHAMHAADAFTAAANLAGLPAVSVPIGSADGLPIGGQLIGRAWEEPRLLGIAAALEAACAP